eukprot:TRINITY_DN20961_c0_g3_i1.p1 TRINITY_DN20961_c0_g3~~TRINITY_DN20961_c0_g3_i1.p1  ORF type:complete len:259 (-),score=58.85 TRINITY_DN20961_c0_g3_i1:115-891(-)
MIRRPPRSTLSSSSAASDVYKRQSENWTDETIGMRLDHQGDLVRISTRGEDHVVLTTRRFELLRRSYMDRPGIHPARLLAVLFVLCTRYETLMLAAPAEGAQAALPHHVFKALEQLGVAGETFASPLNQTGSGRYFSLFPDVDCMFGSSGRFGKSQESEEMTGVYEMNPPFGLDVGLLLTTVGEMLSATRRPLEFILFLPQPVWAAQVTEHPTAVQFMEHCQIIHEHCYLFGTQHKSVARSSGLEICLLYTSPSPRDS